ncbi:hypothetical protein PspLS_09814 [Pyricularia sp. CBS 133598]|nr:hypothetical protein PspLS_09814 [Pyricularia sp. CBS 133598]
MALENVHILGASVNLKAGCRDRCWSFDYIQYGESRFNIKNYVLSVGETSNLEETSRAESVCYSNRRVLVASSLMHAATWDTGFLGLIETCPHAGQSFRDCHCEHGISPGEQTDMMEGFWKLLKCFDGGNRNTALDGKVLGCRKWDWLLHKTRDLLYNAPVLSVENSTIVRRSLLQVQVRTLCDEQSCQPPQHLLAKQRLDDLFGVQWDTGLRPWACFFRGMEDIICDMIARPLLYRDENISEDELRSEGLVGSDGGLVWIKRCFIHPLEAERWCRAITVLARPTRSVTADPMRFTNTIFTLPEAKAVTITQGSYDLTEEVWFGSTRTDSAGPSQTAEGGAVRGAPGGVVVVVSVVVSLVFAV